MEDNVILIGFMGAGKSTVGRRLAQRVSRRFVDVDAVVEDMAGMSVADIFAVRANPRFAAGKPMPWSGCVRALVKLSP